MLITKIKSWFISLQISISRAIDHSYRLLTGLPTAKRSMITPEIYLGGQFFKPGIATLQKLGVTGIVSMRSSIMQFPIEMKNFHTLHLPTTDLTAPSTENLLLGIEFIKKEIDNKGKVYVHCRAGEGRGPTMVLSYLMSKGLTLKDALDQVQKVRPFARPTPPQMVKLKEIEEYFKNNKTA
ncbi:MAG: dual specificity protein phosphatase family protein [bacterium]|nr:dual specificity protein phosphatase family protein [bacterium]